jgi:hypothetical protein
MRSDSPHVLGEPVTLSFNLSSLHIFDRGTGRNRHYPHV